MHVVFFDIDGTLLLTGGAGSASLQRAMEEEFDVQEEHDVLVHGRTDRGIAANLFDLHDIDNSEEHWHRFRNAYLRHLSQQLPQRDGYLLPGVLSLLDTLEAREDVTLALLTGNAHEGAQLKLDHFGLYERFEFGGFGDHSPQRNGVAREAVAAARDHLDGTFCDDKMWVIGDTPFDITCARAIGAHAIGVTTGMHTREQLAAEEPDMILDDLLDPNDWLQRLQ